MKTLNNLRSTRYRRMVIARFMIMAIVTGILLMPPMNREGMHAQTACRSASNLSFNQIGRAFLTPFGAGRFRIRFEIRQPHAMFCDADVFVICNRDKFAKKEEFNVNVVNAIAFGVCNEFHEFNSFSSSFAYAVKIRFQENFLNGFPNGNPKRKVVVFPVDLSLSTYGEAEEVEITHLSVDLPDDGSDN